MASLGLVFPVLSHFLWWPWGRGFPALGPPHFPLFLVTSGGPALSARGPAQTRWPLSPWIESFGDSQALGGTVCYLPSFRGRSPKPSPRPLDGASGLWESGWAPTEG